MSEAGFFGFGEYVPERFTPTFWESFAEDYDFIGKKEKPFKVKEVMNSTSGANVFNESLVIERINEWQDDF
ncbi:hypothetical protein KC717_06740 [Candidatus Dojkabacteria bacterium]|uniref:Uncharacterized protein n=1 Tax=Candidatus Dojkabacteria bacterium TaxID=2099670 RepID=A0A955L932_9BACT|nr:hypothetical protein [Candidatus Dojkabacteria bacterium]